MDRTSGSKPKQISSQYFDRKKYILPLTVSLGIGVCLLLAAWKMYRVANGRFYSDELWGPIFYGMGRTNIQAVLAEFAKKYIATGVVFGLGCVLTLPSACRLLYYCARAFENWMLKKSGTRLVCKVDYYDVVREQLECSSKDELLGRELHFKAAHAGLYEDIGAAASKETVFIDVYVHPREKRNLFARYFVDIMSARSIIPKSEDAQDAPNTDAKRVEDKTTHTSGDSMEIGKDASIQRCEDAKEVSVNANDEIDELGAKAGADETVPSDCVGDSRFAGDVDDDAAFEEFNRLMELASKYEDDEDDCDVVG